VKRITTNTFVNTRESTIGAAFATIKHKRRNYHIWDTAGQERFGSLIPLYISGATVIIIVYDITKIYSFERVDNYWIPFIRKNLRLDDDEPMPMLYLVGNKFDLSDTHRSVLRGTAKLYADQNGMGFDEVSAKTGDGTSGVFQNIVNFADDRLIAQADQLRANRDDGIIVLNERPDGWLPVMNPSNCSKC